MEIFKLLCIKLYHNLVLITFNIALKKKYSLCSNFKIQEDKVKQIFVDFPVTRICITPHGRKVKDSVRGLNYTITTQSKREMMEAGISVHPPNKDIPYYKIYTQVI